MNEKNFADVFDDIPIKKTTINQIFILRKTKKRRNCKNKTTPNKLLYKLD